MTTSHRGTASEIAAAINALAEFCGPRDVPALTPGELRAAYGWDRADVLVFFGGSLLSGAETVAAAIRDRVADVTMIVGGEGHTTACLRAAARAALPGLDVEEMREADIFAAYLERAENLAVDLLERDSTNCGSNVTNALALLDRHAVPRRRVVLIQDAAMQRRMSAGLRLHAPDAELVDFAAYTPRVHATGASISYAGAPADIWPVDRYAAMLLGEVERLRDDERGYGPNGRGWIAHESIPDEVEAAYAVLRTHGHAARVGNPRWADDTAAPYSSS